MLGERLFEELPSVKAPSEVQPQGEAVDMRANRGQIKHFFLQKTHKRVRSSVTPSVRNIFLKQPYERD